MRKLLATLVMMLVMTGGLIANPVSAHLPLAATVTAAANPGQQIKGTAKQAEGKVQEAFGNLSGDREAQVQGKVKQAEGQIRTTPSDAGGNPVAENSKAVIEGKTQQAESNIRRFQAKAEKDDNLKDALN